MKIGTTKAACLVSINSKILRVDTRRLQLSKTELHVVPFSDELSTPAASPPRRLANILLLPVLALIIKSHVTSPLLVVDANDIHVDDDICRNYCTVQMLHFVFGFELTFIVLISYFFL